MSIQETNNAPRGRGLFRVTNANGDEVLTNRRRIVRAEGKEKTARAPGAVLIGWAAWLLAIIGGGALYVSFSAQFTYIFHVRRQDIASIIEALLLDLLMIVFTLLALGLSRAGKSSRTERALILACAFASAWMNVSAADTASPRSVVAYAVAPIALAVVVDRVVAVIRRHVLADEETSAWTVMGGATMAAARLAGMIVRYSLRFTVDAPTTAKGLRWVIINAAPLPEIAGPAGTITAIPDRPELPRLLCWCTNPLPCLAHNTAVPELPPTKKAALLVLYRGHKDYGNKAVASAVAKELAPLADLQWGTARSYIGEELTRIEVTS